MSIALLFLIVFFAYFGGYYTKVLLQEKKEQ